MIIARTVEEVRTNVRHAREAGKRVAFVPTMGFLHEGHLSLIDVARQNAATYVVVSIFVNPIQFGPNEDFERYPRDEERDRELLEQREVDLLFAPAVDVLLPKGSTTRVQVSGVSAPLEGERRPGHFDGVATIVAKLFNIVGADLAVFGQKDAQQCAVVRKMIRDLDIPIEFIVAPTARERDGLAMSSRNAYLSNEQRAVAPALYRALQAGETAIRNGTRDVDAVEAAMAGIVQQTRAMELDYLRVVDASTFERAVDFDRDLLLVGAVRLGKTRLIDNIPVKRSQ